jgi:protein-S-isoprenylcysteine O-methyltransferase Ste14
MIGVILQLIGVLATLSPSMPPGVSIFLGVLVAVLGLIESTMAFLWMRHCWSTLEMEEEESGEQH